MTLRIAGQRFGRLIAMERSDTKSGSTFKWRCLCDCGNQTLVKGSKLVNGHTSSCGCLHVEKLRQSSVTVCMQEVDGESMRAILQKLSDANFGKEVQNSEIALSLNEQTFSSRTCVVGRITPVVDILGL